MQNQLALVRKACPFFVSPTTIDLMIGQQHLVIDLTRQTVTRSSLMDIIWAGKGKYFVPAKNKTYTTEENYLKEGNRGVKVNGKWRKSSFY